GYRTIRRRTPAIPAMIAAAVASTIPATVATAIPATPISAIAIAPLEALPTFAPPPWAYPIGTAPTAVSVPVGGVIRLVKRFVVAADVTHSSAALDAVVGHGASNQQGQAHRSKSCGQQATLHGFHFGSALVSLSLHSMTPNGAPAGSDMTASMPP